jgi:hypothetical protein
VKLSVCADDGDGDVTLRPSGVRAALAMCSEAVEESPSRLIPALMGDAETSCSALPLTLRHVR